MGWPHIWTEATLSGRWAGWPTGHSASPLPHFAQIFLHEVWTAKDPPDFVWTVRPPPCKTEAKAGCNVSKPGKFA